MEKSTRLIACSKTDRGLHRRNNEDACAVNLARHFCMVADGMGGHAGGELASALFLDSVLAIFNEQSVLGKEQGLSRVKAAFDLANSRILAYAEANPPFAGMGCTAEILTFCRDSFVLGHVGDSRTYLFRNGNLSQLTKDHSLVESQIDEGLLSRQEARSSRLKNILLRAVGNSEKMVVDLMSGDLRPDDIFLLCSDGLYGMVEDQEIQSVLAFDAPLELKAEMLVNMANDAGGKDNVTVVLALMQS
jgi:PPM family protein phosphatase